MIAVATQNHHETATALILLGWLMIGAVLISVGGAVYAGRAWRNDPRRAGMIEDATTDDDPPPPTPIHHHHDPAAAAAQDELLGLFTAGTAPAVVHDIADALRRRAAEAGEAA